MVRVFFDDKFKRIISKIKDNTIQKSVKGKIKKIIENPEIGKPMSNVRKGTRELYASPFRLSYAYHKDKDTIEFLDLYHKKLQ
jgi:mRNA-degrading endonuclease RelE of RelBE toxin-antitoxin system